LGNHDAAKKSMESATSTLNSNDPKVIAKFYYELGFAYHKLKQFDKADAAFEKANFGPFKSQIAKLTPVYYFTLAGSYMRVYDFPTAQKMLQQALEIDKNYAAAYQLMGDLAQKTDFFSPKVIDHYKKAIQHTADLKEVVKLYETAIDMLLNAQKFTEAIALSDECLAKVNNARNVLFMKSTAQFKTGKVKEAIAIMDHLVKDANLTPMEVVVYNFSLGMFHVHQKAYEKAFPFLEAAKKGPFATIAQHELDNIAEFLEAPQQ
jgi:tetratricopeptide (TPR) repeat protein